MKRSGTKKEAMYEEEDKMTGWGFIGRTLRKPYGHVLAKRGPKSNP